MISKKKYLLIASLLMAGMLMLAACIQNSPTTVSPTPSGTGGQAPEIPEEIRGAVAAHLGVNAAQLQIQDLQQVEWPDACLGLAQPDEMCAEVITPGYRLIVIGDGVQYQVHTDLSGTNIRVAGGDEQAILEALAAKLGVAWNQLEIQVLEPVTWPDACLGIPEAGEVCAQIQTPGYGGMLVLDGEQFEFRMNESAENIRLIPGAALSARQTLAFRLGLSMEQISIIDIQPQEWPDACLGLAQAGQICAQMITPGYLVVLEVNGDQYEYRTDQAGSLVVLAEAPDAEVENTVIAWTSPDATDCQTAYIDEQLITAGACSGPLLPGRFVSGERQARLANLAAKFMSFEADTPAGKIQFSGQGQIIATLNQQRMIAEWARLAAQEAISGRSGASWGLVFTWDREGGIAGFCDHLEVYTYGEAYASTCAPAEDATYEPVLLNDSQLRQIYTWMDNYKDFEFEHTDPATADAMTIRITFSGTGDMEAGEVETMAMQEWAAELFAQATTPQDPEDLAAARAALTAYLEHLNEGRFEEAVKYYGGSYEELVYFNPDIDQSDHASLFEAACTINGMVCLPLMNVVDEAQISSAEFRITVELKDEDGKQFVFGPCCGADPAEEPPQTQFLYTVLKVDGEFLVQEPPIYVP
jgi:hypothetical protein